MNEPSKSVRHRPRNPPRGERGPDEWRAITDFGGLFLDLYEVSNLGRVWAAPRKRTPGGILSQDLYGQYYAVWLCAGEVQQHVRVHVLVATAFHGPCPPGMEVRHGPAGRLLNWAVNLSYGTQSDNMADRVRDGTSNRGEQDGQAKLTREIVRSCRERVRNGESQAALARELRVSGSAISDLVCRRTWAWLD